MLSVRVSFLTSALAAVLLVVLPVLPAAASSRPDFAAVDNFVRGRLRDNRIPGASIAVTKGTTVLHTKGYGESAGRAIAADSQFRVGSLSKSFTATAVMQLVEKNHLSLDAPVRQYLPEFALASPQAADKITVRQLLNHTSGLGDAGFSLINDDRAQNLQQRLQQFRQASTVHEPGRTFQYFDGNYQILARMVEVVSGQDFSVYLRDHIFEPLGMRSTLNAATTAEGRRASKLVSGHMVVFGIAVQRQELEGFLSGSGGVITTAQDMARWLMMHTNQGQLDGATIVSPESVRLMHTPPRNIPGSVYGMGWLAAPDEAAQQITHTGVLATTYSEQALLLKDGYGVVLLYDSNNALANAAGIKDGVVAMLTGHQPAKTFYSLTTAVVLLAALTLTAVLLRSQALRRAALWAARWRKRHWWRTIPSLLWQILPLILLAFMPQIVGLFAGRKFTFIQLLYTMPDVFVWLGVSGLFGAALASYRVFLLARTD